LFLFLCTCLKRNLFPVGPHRYPFLPTVSGTRSFLESPSRHSRPCSCGLLLPMVLLPLFFPRQSASCLPFPNFSVFLRKLPCVFFFFFFLNILFPYKQSHDGAQPFSASFIYRRNNETDLFSSSLSERVSSHLNPHRAATALGLLPPRDQREPTGLTSLHVSPFLPNREHRPWLVGRFLFEAPCAWQRLTDPFKILFQIVEQDLRFFIFFFISTLVQVHQVGSLSCPFLLLKAPPGVHW